MRRVEVVASSHSASSRCATAPTPCPREAGARPMPMFHACEPAVGAVGHRCHDTTPATAVEPVGVGELDEEPAEQPRRRVALGSSSGHASYSDDVVDRRRSSS